jgi:pantothenate synthetase
VSILVNPTQFNNARRFKELFPGHRKPNVQMLMNAGVDILFEPSINEMYGDGPSDGAKTDKEKFRFGNWKP